MVLVKAFDGEVFYWYENNKGAQVMSEGCKQSRVMTTDEWKATHDAHGEPSKQLNEHQPPKGTYTIYTLICPCGARHVLTTTEDKP